jgi:hypothetical protein
MWETIGDWLWTIAGIWVMYRFFLWMYHDFMENIRQNVAASNFSESGQICLESSEIDEN